MLKVSTRMLVMGVVSLLGLVLGYGVIFCFYAAGLLGDGSHVPAALWERTLRGTVLLGPFLGGFLLLAFLAWREKWSSGMLPWAFGAAAVLLLARHDAGILSPFDLVWVLVTLFLITRMGKEPGDGDEDAE